MVSATVVLLCALSSPGQEATDPRAFVDLLESLQPELRDFRCEFEGTLSFKNKAVQELRGLNEDGLFDTFTGVFVWKSDGSTYVNTLHRHEPSGEIEKQLVLVKDGEAHQYAKMVDDPDGATVVDDPLLINPDRSGSLGSIFLIDTIRRLSSMRDMEATTGDDVIDGKACKVLAFTQRSSGFLLEKFWIDLQRGGNTIRRESYVAGEENLVSRIDITLDRFEVGDASIWMPVSGVIEGHSSTRDGKPYFPKEPTSIEQLYIVHGTLEFNQNPPPSTFEASYTPGTPISDNLRKVQYQFSQQKPPDRVTRAQAESMLRDQLALAEDQGNELVAGSPARRGRDWSSLLVWVFGACALVASILVVLRRR